MTDVSTPESLIGGDILGLITIGMYDNPLAIYREYIQNSADAVSATEDTRNGRVEIDIDPSRLHVRIRDNGPGLSHEEAVRALLPIARSQKRRETDRGFRGIGRLSGLAFAESVEFLTRTEGKQPVTRIVWDGPKLHNSINKGGQTGRTIQECVSVETLSGPKYPAHFFEVNICGVGRHAAGLILNREAVRTYISEVCPVPMAPKFPFVSEVEDLFEENESPLALEIILNGESTPVTRRYGKMIRFSKDRKDSFTEFEKIDISSVDGDRSAAIGWVAHSSYLGMIPKEIGVRGIRARVGNIQIGDETIFDRLFPEERFNRWCVGELHIVDSRVVPNGRRDYFEPGPHIRNLENQIGTIARRIATRCRTASATRNKEHKFHSALHQLEDAYDLAVSGYLSPEDAKDLVRQALNHIPRIQENVDSMNSHSRQNLKELNALQSKLGNFRAQHDHSLLGGVEASEVATYRKIFQALVEASQSPRVAKELIEAVLSHA